MLNNIKGRIYSILSTARDALNQIAKAGERDRQELAMIVREGLEAVDEIAAMESPGIESISADIFSLLHRMTAAPARKQALSRLMDYNAAIELIPTQYKVVFLPYYENTWDSLKSVYEAFSEDPQFVCETVIIPIERNTATGGKKFVYDDYLTPKGIKNTPYADYDITQDHPDIVFFNNPYDGVNIEKFRSDYMRPHARLLFYVPYHMARYMGEHQNGKSYYLEDIKAYMLPGMNNANICMMQSANTAKIWEERTGIKNKAAVLGNPKQDYLYHAEKTGEFPHYPEWEETLRGKKVFLLNTHYTVFGDPQMISPVIEEIFNYAEKDDGIALIWRPHPQTFIVYEGMENNPGVRQFYALIDRANASGRILLDRTNSALSAFMYADILVSSHSSIVAEALFLKKPIFLMDTQPLLYEGGLEALSRPDFQKAIDFVNAIDENDITLRQAVYREGLTAPLTPGDEETMLREYREKAQIKPFRAFMEAMMTGKDEKKDLREKYHRQAYANPDGNCGQATLEFIKTRL